MQLPTEQLPWPTDSFEPTPGARTLRLISFGTGEIIIKGELTCKGGEIPVIAAHHKEKRGGGGGRGNLLEECIQQNRRTEIASSGEWQDTARRCQGIGLRGLSWNLGSQPGASQKARERQGPTGKKNGARTYIRGRVGGLQRILGHHIWSWSS